MPSYTWIQFTTALLKIGRAEVLVGTAFGDGTADLDLSHIGVTEEPIQPTSNESYNDLTLPEHTGPGIIDRKYEGESPVLEFNVIAADLATFATLSPVGARGAGFEAPQDVTVRTVALIPTAAIMEGGSRQTLAYTTGGGWTVGGDAATPDQLAYLDMSLWLWRCHFNRGNPRYANEEGGKAIIPVTLQVMQDFQRPDGQQLYTLGDPADVYIDISPVGG